MKEPKTVKIISSGGIAQKVRVVDQESGSDLKGIECLAIPRFKGGDVICVELTLSLVDFELEGSPVYGVVHPETGEWTQISSIVFADGTTFQAK